MDATMEATIRELVAYADTITPGGITALDLVNAMADDELDPEVHADLDEITANVNLGELIEAMESDAGDMANE